MKKDLITKIAILGALGFAGYKLMSKPKKDELPPPPPSPVDVGKPQTEAELRAKLKRAGASLLEIARQVYAWNQARKAKKG